MKRKSKRVNDRDHVGDLLKNPPSDPHGNRRSFAEVELERMKRRFDIILAELKEEWRAVKNVGGIHVRRV
jgi:hypothetical protein